MSYPCDGLKLKNCCRTANQSLPTGERLPKEKSSRIVDDVKAHWAFHSLALTSSHGVKFHCCLFIFYISEAATLCVIFRQVLVEILGTFAN